MAESFYRAGVNCDVAAIERTGGDTWKAFCDCMFQPGSADWTKCVARACLLPWGCPNPSRNGALDPFNSHPAMLAPPWTDGGAAARGIPKRNASLANTLVGLTTVNAAEYTPLGLWQTYWLNPAKYAVLMAQLSLFVPVIGAAIVQAINSVGPIAPPLPLIPLALPEISARGLKVETAILEPAFKGSIKNIGSVLQYLGNCGIGANIPCGAGLAVKRAAQDQIDTGEINRIQDPTTRAIIVFLSKSGDTLTEAVMKSVTGAMNNGVFAALESGFLAAEQFVRNTDAGAASALLILGKAAGVGAVIASGVAQKRDAALIADDISDKLLGFRPSVYFQLIKTSADTATAYVRAAQSTQGTGFEKAQAVISAVSQGLQQMAEVINKLSAAIGGGLSGLAGTFVQAANAVSGSSQAALQAQQQILATQNPPGAFIGPSPMRTGVAILPTQKPPAVVTTQPPTSLPTSQTMSKSYLPTFLGGAVGALFAGPAGAAVGAGAGLLARQFTGSRPVSGFGRFRELTAANAQGAPQMVTIIGPRGPMRVDSRSFAESGVVSSDLAAAIKAAQAKAAAQQTSAQTETDRLNALMQTMTMTGTSVSVTGTSGAARQSAQAQAQVAAAAMQADAARREAAEAAAKAEQARAAAEASARSEANYAAQQKAMLAQQAEAVAKEKARAAAAAEAAQVQAARDAAAARGRDALIAQKEAEAKKAAETERLNALIKTMQTKQATPTDTQAELPPVIPAFPGTNDSAPPVKYQLTTATPLPSGAAVVVGLGVLGVGAYLFSRRKRGSP